MVSRSEVTEDRPGRGVDSEGGSVADPTESVRALNEAGNKRQDDLRELTKELYDCKNDCLEKIAVNNREHAKEIREIETKRLDAIRQVDVLAVSTAADRAQAAIQALAATTTANAENLRVLVTTTATTIASQTANTIGAITERLAALEKSSYEGKGKSAYSDPVVLEMGAELKALRSQIAASGGTSAGKNQMWGWVAGGIGLLLALITVAVNVSKTL